MSDVAFLPTMRATTPLRLLAQHHGLALEYVDGIGQKTRVSSAVLEGALFALGEQDLSESGIQKAIRAQDAGSASEMLLNPCAVAWDGCVDPRVWSGKGVLTLCLESSASRSFDRREDFVQFCREPVEFGVHRLECLWEGRSTQGTLIAAPTLVFRHPPAKRTVGFLPFYALWNTAEPVAHVGLIRSLLDFCNDTGFDALASLPLGPVFLDGKTIDPSPYAPQSRLFWNDFFLDPRSLPEFRASESAQKKYSESNFASLEQREGGFVDYAAWARFRREILRPMAELAFKDGPPKAYSEYAKHYPEVDAYAHFRSYQASGRTPPPAHVDWGWENSLDELCLERYVQWRTHEAMLELAKHPVGLYLDVPVGVHPQGFDAWYFKDIFAPKLSVGCPPDLMFSQGQNWGFPPLLPKVSRVDGHRYIRRSIQHLCRVAKVLRLDHVMSLFRLYVIPSGMSGAEGTYLHYPLDEMMALYSLESHRHRCELVGEDLGTVPPEIQRAMDRHALRRMHIFQLEALGDPKDPLKDAGKNQLASVNTHDLPMFAAFVAGEDIDLRLELGLCEEAGALVERAERETLLRRACEALACTRENLLDALMVHDGLGDAPWVLASFEDLWGEHRPQNIPGTASWERDNWNRQTAQPFSTWSRDAKVLERIERLQQARRKTR